MFTFTTHLRIYHSIYSITESIYEIIAKYQANDDQCCRNTSLKYTMTFYSLTSIYISH